MGAEVVKAVKTFINAGITVDIISEKLGTVRSKDNFQVDVNETFLTTDPVLPCDIVRRWWKSGEP